MPDGLRTLSLGFLYLVIVLWAIGAPVMLIAETEARAHRFGLKLAIKGRLIPLIRVAWIWCSCFLAMSLLPELQSYAGFIELIEARRVPIAGLASWFIAAIVLPEMALVIGGVIGYKLRSKQRNRVVPFRWRQYKPGQYWLDWDALAKIPVDCLVDGQGRRSVYSTVGEFLAEVLAWDCATKTVLKDKDCAPTRWHTETG